MLKKLDIGTSEIEQVEAFNALVDVVNKQQDIIRQIGEWGSSKGECLWCDTLTEFNPKKPTISKMEKVETPAENVQPDAESRQENVQKEPITLLDIFNEIGEMYSSLWNKMEDIHHDLKTKGGNNDSNS